MADRHWEQLQAYRSQAGQWQHRGLGLAATRLRVAKLLESAFGYGLDDVEAEVDFAGTKADFVLLHDGNPWAGVIVRAMAEGLGAVPPPEAFVIADASGVAWYWVTDGLGVQVYHIAPDLMPSRIVHCHVLSDAEVDLQAAWRLLLHRSVAAGDLEAYRQARERPDDAAVAAALLHPDVLDALHDALAETYPRPGTAPELASQVRRVLHLAATPAAPEAMVAPPVTAAPEAPAVAEPSEAGSPPVSLASQAVPAPLPPEPGDHGALAAKPTDTPAKAPATGPQTAVPAPTVAEAVDLPPATSPARPVAPSLSALLPKRRRRAAWRVDAGSGVAPLPPVGPRHGPRETEGPAVGADPDTEDDPAATPLIEPERDEGSPEAAPPAPMAHAPGPNMPAPAGAPPAGSDGAGGKGRAMAVPSPAGTSLRSAIERQRQAHERLRQNLRDLRENRARLQDALAELREDYPERFATMLDAKRQSPATPPPKTSSSWIRLGPMQAHGNGYWEQMSSRMTSFR